MTCPDCVALRELANVLIDTIHDLILKLNHAVANHGSTTAKEKR